MTSFTNEQRQREGAARNCQKYRCQSAWNLDTQYQSWTAHLLLDTPLLHWRRTVSRHGGTNLRSIILNRDTGMPQTWGVTWPCWKQHVGWPTVQMVCSWRSTQTAAGCVHFQKSHTQTVRTSVHVTSFTPVTKARPFKTPPLAKSNTVRNAHTVTDSWN
jgi:hypothetical protein